MNVFITGANRGIGLELARRHLIRGDRVIAAVREPRRADALIEAGRAQATGGGQLDLVELDLIKPDSIGALCKRMPSGVEVLDRLYNNAGVLPDRAMLGALDGEALARMFQVNASGPILVLQALRGLLRTSAGTDDDGGARVVNVSSGYGSIAGNDGSFPYGYAASKAALNMFTRSAALSLRGEGIVVVAMCPGWVRTDMGGDSATLSVEESVGGILTVIATLTLDDTGSFVGWDGKPRQW